MNTIAQAYEISSQTIRQSNNIQDSSKVQPGDTVWVPKARKSERRGYTFRYYSERHTQENPTPEPRVKEKIVPTPTPAVEETKTADAEPDEVEFPRAVKRYGPIRFQWPLKDTFQILRP